MLHRPRRARIRQQCQADRARQARGPPRETRTRVGPTCDGLVEGAAESGHGREAQVLRDCIGDGLESKCGGGRGAVEEGFSKNCRGRGGKGE
jgi:hypothetical protein